MNLSAHAAAGASGLDLDRRVEDDSSPAIFARCHYTILYVSSLLPAVSSQEQPVKHTLVHAPSLYYVFSIPFPHNT
jgi:hypothetical protein